VQRSGRGALSGTTRVVRAPQPGSAVAALPCGCAAPVRVARCALAPREPAVPRPLSAVSALWSPVARLSVRVGPLVSRGCIYGSSIVHPESSPVLWVIRGIDRQLDDEPRMARTSCPRAHGPARARPIVCLDLYVHASTRARAQGRQPENSRATRRSTRRRTSTMHQRDTSAAAGIDRCTCARLPSLAGRSACVSRQCE